jgi:phage protein D
MNIVKLDKESVDQGGFYIPRFEVRIEGVGLPKDVLRDVMQITYQDNIKEIDSVELTINNWDSIANDFKYIGSEILETLNTNPLYRLFEPCNKEVQVSMGYGSNLTVMLTGTFTTMEPDFPSSGAPTLAVRVLDVLHQLRRKPYTKTWENMRDSDIVKNIETLMDQGKKRFPLHIVIDENARDHEPPLPIVMQKNQYDIDFILTRARERGYVVFIKEATIDPRTKKKLPRRLYFGPSEGRVSGLRDVTFELERGKSLIAFKPTLTTAHQAKTVTVNGWDRRKKKAITARAALKDVKLNSDLKELLEKCDAREAVVVEVPVFTEKEAQALAKSLLQDRFKEVVKASGTTIGLPDLRAGQRVLITGIGSRLSGIYFVTDTTHTIGDGGYTTRFNARREDEKPGGK